MSDSYLTQRKWSHLEVAKLLISRTAMTELSLDDAKKVVQRMHTVAVKEGTVLVQQGSSSNNNYMLLILNGEAVVEAEGLKKKDSLILGVVGTGHIIGEMGLVDGEARSATCTASSDVDVAVLDSKALSELIETEPITSCKLLATLLQRASSRLRTTNCKLRVLTHINRALEEEISSLDRVQRPLAQPVTYAANPLMF
ncbi:MAG: cyclic nucleotide-binding domain-containing protein [Pseudomonadota bacterium]